MKSLDLDDAFEDLMRKANPDVPEYSTQYHESRCMFFCGAVITHMWKNMLVLSDDAAEAELKKVENQIDEFFNERLPRDKD